MDKEGPKTRLGPLPLFAAETFCSGCRSSAAALDHSRDLVGGQWQGIVLVGGRTREKINMNGCQTEVPQSGYG